MWAFVPYKAVTISNNTVSGCDVGSAALASCNLAGNNNCPGGVIPTVTFSNNNITGNGAAGGAGLYVTTNTFGFGDGDVKVAADHNALCGRRDRRRGRRDRYRACHHHHQPQLARRNVTGAANTGATTVDAAAATGGVNPRPSRSQRVWRPARSRWRRGCRRRPRQQLHPDHPPSASSRPGRRGQQWHDRLRSRSSLDRPSSTPVTVMWDTVNGTAAAGSDSSAPRTCSSTFNPGQVLQFITVNVNGDTQAGAEREVHGPFARNVERGAGEQHQGHDRFSTTTETAARPARSVVVAALASCGVLGYCRCSRHRSTTSSTSRTPTDVGGPLMVCEFT